jgi:2-polyprenyl-6-methoxyphenol hydroxylase-like FAD-dependent oxidoreductase
MTTEQTDVLVVGAGPVGLTAAIVLTQRGHAVTLLDSQTEGANTSRAAVVHSRTLELLEPYGVTPELVARGVHIPTFTVRDRDDLLMSIPFDTLPTPYPYTLMISQAETETLLLKRLHDLGGRVTRPASVSAVDQGPDGVTATLRDGQRIPARYLIGADGVRSTIREQIGSAFSGSTYAESFVLADVRLSGGVPVDEVILYFAPAGLMVLAPLPDDRYRIVATVDDAPEVPDAAFVQRLLDERGPRSRSAVVHDVQWGSRFRVHHRVAESFRAGRVLLAGDAAHVHSPAGGQGMNLGIEDAVTAAECLSGALLGHGRTALAGYDTQRRQAAERVVRLADRLTGLATLSARGRPLRNAALRVVGAVPAPRRRLALQLSGLDRR